MQSIIFARVGIVLSISALVAVGCYSGLAGIIAALAVYSLLREEYIKSQIPEKQLLKEIKETRTIVAKKRMIRARELELAR